MRFCPKCGKEVKKPRVFCSECSPSEIALKDISVKICTGCGSYLSGGKWIAFDDLEDLLKALVKESTGIPVKEIDMTCLKKTKAILKNSQTIGINVTETACNACSKRGTQYFEGILQLRNPNSEAVDFIRAEIEKRAGKGVHLTKTESMKSGIDFYITSKRFMNVLAKMVQRNFGGVLKTSSQLFSKNRQTSKDIYRVNILIELPSFRKGDIILSKERVIEVTTLGESPSGTDLATGKTALISYKDKAEVLKKHKTRVSNNYPELEVLHPTTFQSTKVQNPERYSKGESVAVVMHEGRVFLV